MLPGLKPLRHIPYAIPLLRICLTLVTIFAQGRELLGHKDVQTTMIYTHVLNKGERGVRSPLDR